MNRFVVTVGKFCIQLGILYITGVLPHSIPKLQILHRRQMGNTSARLYHEQNRLTTYPNYSFMVVKDDQRIHKNSRS
jgi:hypothetical protein